METTVFDRIKQLCDRDGISLRVLEMNAGLTTGVSYRWSKGSSPSAGALVKVANYFNVSVDYLLGRTETEETIDDWMTEDDLISLQRAMLKVPKDHRKSVAEFLEKTFGDS